MVIEAILLLLLVYPVFIKTKLAQVYTLNQPPATVRGAIMLDALAGLIIVVLASSILAGGIQGIAREHRKAHLRLQAVNTVVSLIEATQFQDGSVVPKSNDGISYHVQKSPVPLPLYASFTPAALWRITITATWQIEEKSYTFSLQTIEKGGYT